MQNRTDVIINIEPELTLLADLLKTKDTTTLQQTAGLLGFALGVLATYYEFTLGYDFSKNFGARDPKAESIAQVIFGGATALPAAALIGLPTYDYFVNLLDFASRDKLPAIKHPHVVTALTIVSHVLALPAGAPFSFQVASSLAGKLPLQITFAASCFVVSFACAQRGIESFYLKKFLKHYRIEDDVTKQNRLELNNIFSHILKNIYLAHDEVINYLFSYYQTQLTEKDFDKLFFKKIKEYLHLDLTSQNTHATETICQKVGNYCGDAVAGSLGVITTSTLYFLALDAGNWLVDWLGIEDNNEREALKHAVASTGTLTTGLFVASAAMQSLREYVAFFRGKASLLNQEVSHPYLRRSIHAFSILLGTFSAIPTFQLSLTQNENLAFNTTVLCGQSLSLVLAINLLLQSMVTAVDRKFFTNTPAFRRDFFIHLFTVLLEKINWQYNPQQLQHLHQIFNTELKPESSIAVIKNDEPPSPLRANNLFQPITSIEDISISSQNTPSP